jgi:hypothetical protein
MSDSRSDHHSIHTRRRSGGPILPINAVLDIIRPADPDRLEHVGRGLYEASWGHESMATEDLEHLTNKRDRITLVSKTFRPVVRPNAFLVIHFTVKPTSAEARH